MLQMCGKRCKERVADGGHDDTDQIRTIMIQIAGKLVRHIIEGLHGFAHTFAHVIRHVPVAVHHQRDGAQRHPGLLRHIAHADHDRIFPVITVLSLYVHVLTTKYYIHLHSLEPVRQSGNEIQLLSVDSRGGEGLQQRLGLVECNHQRCIRTGGLDGGCAQISFTLLSDRPCNVKITPDWQAAQCRNRWPRK